MADEQKSHAQPRVGLDGVPWCSVDKCPMYSATHHCNASGEPTNAVQVCLPVLRKFVELAIVNDRLLRRAPKPDVLIALADVCRVMMKSAAARSVLPAFGANVGTLDARTSELSRWLTDVAERKQ